MAIGLDKAAHWHNIGTFWLTALMLAVVVWPSIFPKSTPQVDAKGDKKQMAMPKPIETGGTASVNWWMAGVVAFAFLSAGVLNVIAARSRTKTDTSAKKQGSEIPELPQLVIHRAIYGRKEIEDLDVTPKLNSYRKNALALYVSNSLVPRDPAINRQKRIEVQYSFGISARRTLSRREDEILVLPEDESLQKRIEDLEKSNVELADCLKLKESFQQQITEQQIRDTEVGNLRIQAISLKEKARDIQRLWPEAEFLRRPLFRLGWLPPAGPAGRDPEWLRCATSWHRDFFGQSFSKVDELYLFSLDFDEVLAFLDNVEYSVACPPMSRSLAVTEAQAPIVRLVSWDRPFSGPNVVKCGFKLRVTGTGDAHNVRLAGTIQPWVTIEFDPIPRLSKEQLDAFSVVSQYERGVRTGVADLAKLINSTAMNPFSGQIIHPVVRVIFDDGLGHTYASRHKLVAAQNDVQPIYVQPIYINTERVAI